MQYSILFCLVFTLIHSKLEINRYKSFLNVAKNMLSSEDDDDTETCTNAENQKTCVNQKIDDPMECCYLSGTFTQKGKDPQQEKVCQALPNRIGDIKDIITLAQTKELFKEVYGYVLVNGDEEDMPDDFSSNIQINCKKVEIKTDFSFSLTDDDRRILSSDTHCFYPIYNSMEGGDGDDFPYIDDSVKCENYLLRSDSKKAGIECGYLKAEVTYEKQTQTAKTCFPFNKELLTKVTKSKLFKEYINMMNMGMDDIKFNIEFYNAKGDKVKFDSTRFLTSNLLILLLFILFMF